MDSYDGTCCWEITEKSSIRFTFGDSKHGQGQTRFVRAILTITRFRLEEAALGSKWKVLLMSNAPESALVSASFGELEDFEVVQQINEEYISVNILRDVVKRTGLDINYLLLIYAFSGCMECPSTRNVPEDFFTNALLYYKSEEFPLATLQFKTEGNRISLEMEDDGPLLSQMEIIFCIAFLMERYRKRALPSDMRSVLLSDSARFCEQARWHGSTDLLRQTCPSYLLPERGDLELQSRRAVSTLQYWKHSATDACGREQMIVEPKTGYKTDGIPIHETVENLNRRRNIMKKLFHSCSCSSGCKDPGPGVQSRCGCRRKSPPMPCLLCKCGPNCTNQGTSFVTAGGDGNRESNTATASGVLDNTGQNDNSNEIRNRFSLNESIGQIDLNTDEITRFDTAVGLNESTVLHSLPSFIVGDEEPSSKELEEGDILEPQEDIFID